MPHDTRPAESRAHALGRQAPPYRGGVVHHHDFCAIRCPYCGPDSTAWAVGEAVVGTLIAFGTAAVWLVRHPTATLVVLGVVFLGWALLPG